MSLFHYCLILSLLVVVFVAADWNKDPAINKPFTAGQRATIKACFKPQKKTCKGERVCTADGKGFKNMCKLMCAFRSGWSSRIVKCPPTYHTMTETVAE
ncbi:hypothetical protein BV898_04541 [Hypsibius exemplaris]|uniref:Kazal-like domain-containing protein n=1 Tax=Hypsibius exemplaris TaxID=2072580 RepID=A0A1W0X2U8_HYPEX|nr:hypothetical protein BV898_04541 [Hypsibius exemplaris]